MNMRTNIGLKNGAALCAFASAAAFMPTPASANTPNVTIYKAVHHDTSQPLSEMIRTYNEQHAHDVHFGHYVIPLLPGPATKKLPFVADGIRAAASCQAMLP